MLKALQMESGRAGIRTQASSFCAFLTTGHHAISKTGNIDINTVPGYFDNQKEEEGEALAPSWNSMNDTRTINGQTQSTAEATQAQATAVEGLLCGACFAPRAWTAHFSDDETGSGRLTCLKSQSWETMRTGGQRCRHDWFHSVSVHGTHFSKCVHSCLLSSPHARLRAQCSLCPVSFYIPNHP